MDQLEITGRHPSRASVRLPIELLMEIFEWIEASPNRQATLANAVRVNKSWYYVGIRYLFASPDLHDGNIREFIMSLWIKPAGELSRKTRSKLGPLVTSLELSNVQDPLISDGLIAAVIKLCKDNLDLFYAPMQHVGPKTLVALGDCKNLQYLSFEAVATPIDVQSFQIMLQKLDRLKVLELSPEAEVGLGVVLGPTRWPASLKALSITGLDGAKKYLPEMFAPVPSSVDRLSTLHLGVLLIKGGGIRVTALRVLLQAVGPTLSKLSINNLVFNETLNDVFLLCPRLRILKTPLDLIDGNALALYSPEQLDSEGQQPTLPIKSHPLAHIELFPPVHHMGRDPYHSSDPTVSVVVIPLSIYAWLKLLRSSDAFQNMCTVVAPGTIIYQLPFMEQQELDRLRVAFQERPWGRPLEQALAGVWLYDGPETDHEARDVWSHAYPWSLYWRALAEEQESQAQDGEMQEGEAQEGLEAGPAD